jgi:hypothetical protein
MISVPFGPSAFVKVLGPPTELRGGADAVDLSLQGGAVGQLGVFAVFDAGERPVAKHVVGQRPPMLGRLQLGGVGRQEQHGAVLGHAEVGAGGPAGAVQDEDDLLLGASPDATGKRHGQTPRANATGKRRTLDLDERDRDGGRQGEARAAGGRMDEAEAGAPGETGVHDGGGPVPLGRPDAPQERLEPDAVLVPCGGGSAFAGRLGEGVGPRRHARAAVTGQTDPE